VEIPLKVSRHNSFNMKRSCDMKDSKSQKVDKNIYVASRSGVCRFTVAVNPLAKQICAASPNDYDTGLHWA
jgi:hypothetical protein